MMKMQSMSLMATPSGSSRSSRSLTHGLTLAWAVLAVGALGAPVAAVTVPFTEDFDTTANWADAALNPAGLTLVNSGGPDGSSYVTQTFGFQALMDGDSAVLFRGQDDFGSSGGAFEGNWIADGVAEFSAWVRHQMPGPATFFTRFSGPANFPGAIGVEFVPVFPNVWTEIRIPVTASNPQFVSFEGSDFASVFSNVGHVQVGVDVPAGFGGNPAFWTFDLDQISVTAVPEPAIGCLGIPLLLGALRRRFR